MKKYKESIYNKDYVQQALKISWWEKLLLLFVPKTKVITNESISHYKTLFNKFYLVDFKLTDNYHFNSPNTKE